MCRRLVTGFLARFGCVFRQTAFILPKPVYEKIQAGEAVKLDGQGFMTDDGFTQDFWLFNQG
jgi:hypothetical protein